MESAPATGRRGSIRARTEAALARVPLALIVLVVLGLVLRLALSLVYDPAGMTSYDTLVYVGMAGDELFTDPARTAGYSIFLRGLHAVSADLDFTIAVQHLLGVAAALLVYGAFRRLETPVWVAVIAAAGVLLSLDQVFLEHSLLTEGPFTLLIATVLYAGVRSLEEPRELWRGLTTRHLWIAVAGGALGLSAWFRSLTVPAGLLLVLWTVFALGGRWPSRLGRGLLVAGAMLAVLIVYAAIQSSHNGYFGITPSSGWAFYARTAQFADCTRFDPPAGTERLCEDTPPDDRFGPDFYAWEPGSPARRVFGGQPHGNDELTAFARAAVLHQPLDYLGTVALDSLRYVYPRLPERKFGGVGFDVLNIDLRSPGVEDEINTAVNYYYDDEALQIRAGADVLAGVQTVLRLHPPAMALLTLLSGAALLLARGRLRAGLILNLGAAAALLLIPPATAIWSARYAVPISGPLVGSGAVGAWLLWERQAKRARPGDKAV